MKNLYWYHYEGNLFDLDGFGETEEEAINDLLQNFLDIKDVVKNMKSGREDNEIIKMNINEIKKNVTKKEKW